LSVSKTWYRTGDTKVHGSNLHSRRRPNTRKVSRSQVPFLMIVAYLMNFSLTPYDNKGSYRPSLTVPGFGWIFWGFTVTRKLCRCRHETEGIFDLHPAEHEDMTGAQTGIRSPGRLLPANLRLCGIGTPPTSGPSTARYKLRRHIPRQGTPPSWRAWSYSGSN